MPPKKKGKKSGKKGKKSGKKSAKVEEAPKEEENLNNSGKEFFLIQIHDLEKRLVKFQRKCDELEIMNKKFAAHFEQMDSDKKEICDYLRKSLQQRGDEISELNYELTQLQEARDAEKEMYEGQLEQLKTELNDTKEQLTSENMILRGKLESLEEFKVQKEDLMGKFAEMEQELARIAQEHKDEIYQLERKAVVDKDRLKKEVVERVNNVAAEFRKVSNKQMAETTKRTIRENVDLNSRLQKMSEKTLELIAGNDALKLKDKEYRLEIELLETVEKELSKKNAVNLKSIRVMTDHCREQEAMLADFEAREEAGFTVEAENDLLQRQMLSQENEFMELSADLERLRQETADNQARSRQRRRVLRRINTLLQGVRKALREGQSLLEPDEEMSEAEMIQKRQHMLESILVLMNGASALGLGPNPGDLGNKAAEHYEMEPQSSPVASASKQERPLTKDPLPGPEKLQDFGLVPRPPGSTAFPGQVLRALSPTSRLQRKPTLSAGVQVGDTKALLYAERILAQLPQGAKLMHKAERVAGRQGRKTVPSGLF